MSLIVTVYTNEGIVFASDSRTTETIKIKGQERSYPLSDNVSKTFATKWNYGISTCGYASINGIPISSYLNNYLSSYVVDQSTQMTVESFSKSLCEHFSSIKNIKNPIIFHVGGFDFVDGNYISKMYRCVIQTDETYDIEKAEENICGFSWDGQSEVMLRLIKKQIIAEEIVDVSNININNPDGTKTLIQGAYVIDKQKSLLYEEAHINFNMFTLQDAIDFARFAIRTTIDTQRFLQMEKTVGGPIDVLLIKPTESVWISKKELK